MNNTIPGEPSIVNDDVDFAIAELGGFLHQFGYVVAVEDIPDDGEGTTGLGGVDCVGDGVGFVCLFVRYIRIVNNYIVNV